MQIALTIVQVAFIGLACGLAIYLVYLKVPHKVPGLQKIDQITKLLPGANCGACGYAGCFAFAQAVAKDPENVTKTPCPIMLADHQMVKEFEVALGLQIDAAAISKKAMLHCKGDSEIMYEYTGVQTCKAAALAGAGFKRCPYACLGLGDCQRACQYDAISIDPEKHVAVIDYDKCTGCGLCPPECPQELINMVPARTKVAFRCNYGELKPIPGRERCGYACIHCRKCFTACNYDAIVWNKQKAEPEFDIEKCTLCGDCIEICPNDTLEFFRGAKQEKPAETAIVADTEPGS
jgi:Na+-translocating ferredoxin:NAD+ oxidoreductase RNF subunit RnfB